MDHAPRAPWRDFPDAVLLAPEAATLSHPKYPAAKSGDAEAAAELAHALVHEAGLAEIRELVGEGGTRPAVVSVQAYERDGYNAIPAALGHLVSEHLGTLLDTKIVQTNIVGHTGADGYGRLARQATFAGEVTPDGTYIMVDDFIGQGGTLANLRGWVERHRGTVICAVGLTGKPYSAKLNPTKEQLHELREKHGPDFEDWWSQLFGHTFDCLTQSEARYLARSPDVDTIRNRLAAAMRQGNRRGHPRSPGAQG